MGFYKIFVFNYALLKTQQNICVCFHGKYYSWCEFKCRIKQKACTKVQAAQVFDANWPLIGITE